MDDFEIQVAEFFLSIEDDDNAEALTAAKFNITMETVDYIMQCYAVETLLG